MGEWVASRAMECHGIEAETVPDYVLNSSVPVVMKGFVSSWPAVAAAKGSDSKLATYLQGYDAKLPVTVYTSETPGATIGYTEGITDFSFDRGQSSFAMVLEELLDAQSKRTVYIGSTSVDKWLPGFRQSNDLHIEGAKPLVNCWLGSPVDISAHFDAPSNIACCVAGKRTFTLFPPSQVQNLYVGPVDVTPSGRAISLVDVRRPDFQRFPRFKRALEHALVAELHPGDGLYVPPLWWHHVSSSGAVNLLVNYWWHDMPAHCGNPDLVLEHALLTMRGMKPEQRKSWKALFDYYVFSDSSAATEHLPVHIRGLLDPGNEDAIRRGWLNFAKKLRK